MVRITINDYNVTEPDEDFTIGIKTGSNLRIQDSEIVWSEEYQDLVERIRTRDELSPVKLPFTILDDDQIIDESYTIYYSKPTTAKQTAVGVVAIDTNPESVTIAASSFPPIVLAPSSEPVFSAKTSSLAITLNGYVSGATIFFDANKNGVLDFLDLNDDGTQEDGEPLEPWTVTQADGAFVFSIPAAFDRDNDGFIGPEEGQLVAMGGVDTSTMRRVEVPMIAPTGYFVVSPISTLIAGLANDHGFTLQEAEARVHEAFGLPDVELRSYDHLAAAAAGDPQGAVVFKTEAMIWDTVLQVTELGAAKAAAPPRDFISAAVFKELAAKISEADSQLDLRNSAVVEAIILESLYQSGVVVDQDVVAAAGSVIAAGNAYPDTILETAGVATVEAVARKQIVAQGEAATELAKAARGEVEIATVVEKYTGAALEANVATTAPGNVIAPRIAITDVVQFETDGDTTYVFTVVLTSPSVVPVSVDYTTIDGLATADEGDYDPTSGTLTWAAGDSTSQTIQVRVHGDHEFEMDEFFSLQLSSPVNAVIGKDVGYGFVDNDDPFQYVAPSDGQASDFYLQTHELGFDLFRNDELVFSGYATLPAPLQIIGANGVANSLTVDLLDGGVIPGGGLIFQGGDGADDRLEILDDAARFVTHNILGAGQGSFDVDGTMISYAGVESASDVLAPSITGVPAAPREGDLVTLGSAVNSVFQPALLSYNWTATRVGAPDTFGVGAEYAFTPENDGAYQVSLTVSGQGRGTGVTLASFQVNNVAPSLEAGLDETLPPAALGIFDRSGVAFTDPGLDAWSGTVDYGDGSDFEDLAINQATKSFDLHHVYTLEGVYEVTITIADGGAFITDSFLVSVQLNTAPIAQNDDVTTNEDHAVTFDVFADNGHGTDSDLEANIDPSLTIALTEPTAGMLLNNADGTFSFDPRGAFDYLANGEVAVVSFDYQIADTFGATAAATATITITGVNDGPTIRSSTPTVIVNEGQYAQNAGTFFDLDLSDNITITASLGTITQDAGRGGAWSWSFATQDSDQSQAVTVTADDGHGDVATTTFDLVINNLNPTITSLTSNASALGDAVNNAPVVIQALFADAGITDTHHAVIAWGDGSSTAGTIIESSGSGTVAGSHVYASGGIFTITVTLNDDDGGIGMATAAAFVSGVGLTEDGQLQIIGTDGRDLVHVHQQDDILRVTIKFNPSVNEDYDDEDDDEHENPYASHQRFSFYAADVRSILILGGADNDHIKVGSSVTISAAIDGGAGDDHLRAGSGNDEIVDLLGHNRIHAGKGNDIVTAGAGNDRIWTDGGNDTIHAGDGDNRIHAGNGNNAIYAGSGNDRISSGDGDDIIDAGDGDNDVRSGRGADSIFTGAGRDVIDAGAGNDLVQAGPGSDSVQGGAGNDILVGGAGDDVLIGGDGRDMLIGDYGADRLVGNHDEDILIAGYSAFDSNAAALFSIMNEWTSSGSYAERVANVSNGAGLADGNRLIGDDGLLQTVFNDNDLDTLIGSQGQDWFFANKVADNGGVPDKVTDQTATDLWNDIDF